MVDSPKKNTAGLIMAQREMGFAHPFAAEFKRRAYEAVKRKSCQNGFASAA